VRKPNKVLRLAETARIKQKRKFKYWNANRNAPLEGRVLGKALQTAKPCACYICRNPRRSLTNDFPKGRTRKETSDHEFADLFTRYLDDHSSST